MKQVSLRTLLLGSSFSGNAAFQTAWLLFRFYIGLSLALGAGLPKIEAGFAPEWFEKQVFDLGFTFPSAQFWAAIAAWGEFVGGLCLAFGFLTRLMALQLAFQFFVVSFLWYSTPEPFTGMYYQQLLFWGFVLLLGGGGGRFSVDHYLYRRTEGRGLPRMLRPALAVLLPVVLVSVAAAGKRRPAKTHTVVFRVQVPGPAPKAVTLRGSDAPLSWERDLPLQPDTAAGYYRATVTLRTPWSFSDVKFVRDGVFELDGKGNRRVPFGAGDTTVYVATFDRE